MIILYNWWEAHALDDPEYNVPVDSFYGFGTQLAPLLLQFNILVYRKVLASQTEISHDKTICQTDDEDCLLRERDLPNDAEVLIPPSAEEINELEIRMWQAHENSVMAQYSAIANRKGDIDLLHCNNAFHAASLIWFYTYLKPKDVHEAQIPHLVSSVIEEVKAIKPESRTAAALLFVIYIVGPYAKGPQRTFIHDHLASMKTTCLSSVQSVLEAFTLIWKLRDQNNGIDMIECHEKVYQAGINVCLY